MEWNDLVPTSLLGRYLIVSLPMAGIFLVGYFWGAFIMHRNLKNAQHWNIAKQNALNLYVVGESSANPETWSEHRALVIARDEEEALTLTTISPVVTLVPMSHPRLLELIFDHPHEIEW